MSKFPKRLKEAREDMGLNKTQLAELAGTTTATISRYESGDINVTIDSVEKVAKHLNATQAWLLGWSDEKYYVPPEIPENLKPIPVVESITTAQHFLSNENIKSFEYSNKDASFCLRVHDNGMIGARIYDGDMAFIKKQDDVDHSEIAVVLIEGQIATLKRVFKYGNKIILHSENPTIADKTYIKNDKTIAILGKVIEVKFKAR